MSWLDNVFIDLMQAVVTDGRIAWSKKKTITRLTIQKATAKQEVVDQLLNLIEQSRDKSLPLAWLTGEIKKL